MKIFSKFSLLACLIVIIIAQTGCSSTEPVKKSLFMLDTTCTITAYGAGGEKAIKEAFDLGVEYENMLSTTIEGSEVYKINHADGKPVEVSDDTIQILEKAIYYSQVSDGLFDVSAGSLTSLWGFGEDKKTVPAPEQIEASMATIGYKDIKIDGNTVTLLKPGAQLDFGAIAKGYIADRLSELMISEGIEGGIINLGGNVITFGEKPTGKPWIVGIQQPFADRNETIGAVTVGPKSVVTSGIYERSFTAPDGNFYHHILDLSTGYPVENDLAGVTIISDLSVDGDGLSTTCFLLGTEKATALIESIPDTEAIFLTKGGEIIETSGIGTEIPFQTAGQE